MLENPLKYIYPLKITFWLVQRLKSKLIKKKTIQNKNFNYYKIFFLYPFLNFLKSVMSWRNIRQDSRLTWRLHIKTTLTKLNL